MSRVLITGASGQDGSYLLERLIPEGHDVVALVREESALAVEGVRQRVVDLADHTSLKQVVTEEAPELIINLGGISSVAQSWREPEATLAISGVAVGVMLEAAWQLREDTGADVRFVQASSAEIFAGSGEVPQRETTPIVPINPYGAAKSLAAHLVRIYRLRGLFAASAILFNHESPRRPATFVTRKITHSAARIAAGLQEELVLGDLDTRRDWGWAPDYVDAILAIARAETPDDFVVATGVSHSIREFVRIAFAEAGITDWERYVRSDAEFVRPTDATELVGDTEKIGRVLGWAPTVSFAEMVASMVAADVSLVREER